MSRGRDEEVFLPDVVIVGELGRGGREEEKRKTIKMRPFHLSTIDLIPTGRSIRSGCQGVDFHRLRVQEQVEECCFEEEEEGKNIKLVQIFTCYFLFLFQS